MNLQSLQRTYIERRGNVNSDSGVETRGFWKHHNVSSLQAAWLNRDKLRSRSARQRDAHGHAKQALAILPTQDSGYIGRFISADEDTIPPIPKTFSGR